jgi:DNA polymerase-3 subunit epsilon
MSGLFRSRLPVPDLDVPWRTVEYCVVDVETTGLDLRRDTMICFGSVLIRSGRLHWNTRHSLDIKPARQISVEAMTVHGLRQQDLDSAPPLQQVAKTIVSQLEGRLLVAHAAWVERAFLAEPVRAAGHRWKPAVVDTAALLRAAGVVPSGTGYEPDVEAVADGLGLCVHTPHQALGDAVTTAEVFLAMAARLERDYPRLTARDLVVLTSTHARA